MNNFPAMTEAKRQALIVDCNINISNLTEALRCAELNGWKQTAAEQQSKLLLQQIALAALTAKSIAWIETGTDGFQRGSRLINYFTSDIQGFDNGTLIYAAPPAPVLKPIELPKKYVCDKNGCDDDLLPSWQVMISCDEIIAAIRAAGYEVKQ